MRIVVLGNTRELIVFADLMQKAGATVETVAQPRTGDLGRITPAAVVVAMSSETLTDRLLARVRQTCAQTIPLLCDISDGSPLASDAAPLPEHLLQVASGLAQITGQPDAPPTVSKVPFIAVSSALYAASFVLASARTPRGPTCRIMVSRKLTALNALTTFLPSALTGAKLALIGNAHPASSPWNTYATRDGAVLICTSNDAQWAKLRDVIGSEAARDPVFDSFGARIVQRPTLDAILGA